MKEFILNNRFSLLALIIGISIGAIIYLSKPITYKHRVVYEYNIENLQNIPVSLINDTFFIFKNTPVRNYKTSYADTIVDSGIRRSELILFMNKELSNAAIDARFVQPLSLKQAKFLEVNINVKKRYSKALIIYPIFGLFLSLIIHFFFPNLSLRRK